MMPTIAVSKLREIGCAADFLQDLGALELGFQGHRVGELARLDAPRDGVVDAAVDRVGEMLRRKKLRDTLIGFVVCQQRAEQRLLRLQVGGRQALRQAEQRRIDDGVHAGGV